MQDREKQKWLLQPGGIASRLRSLQKEAGLLGTELAQRIGWPASKVSKLRRGQQVPEPEDIRAWVSAVGAGSGIADELIAMLADEDMHDSAFEEVLKEGQEQHQRDYNELVEQSDTIRMFERTFIPRLLQTFDYAKAVLLKSSQLHKTVDDVDRAAQARLECQRYLHDGEHSFEFVLDEAVLRRRTAPAHVMYGQMDRLLGAVGSKKVTIGIMPIDGDFDQFPRNSFELYGSVGVIETYYSDEAQDDTQWAKYDEVMRSLWQDVVVDSGARALIRDAMRRHERVMKKHQGG